MCIRDSGYRDGPQLQGARDKAVVQKRFEQCWDHGLGGRHHNHRDHRQPPSRHGLVEIRPNALKALEKGVNRNFSHGSVAFKLTGALKDPVHRSLGSSHREDEDLIFLAALSGLRPWFHPSGGPASRLECEIVWECGSSATGAKFGAPAPCEAGLDAGLIFKVNLHEPLRCHHHPQ